MVDVQVRFRHECADATSREWVHEFNIQKGSTIRRLKQVMLLPKGGKEDAEKFELRRLGRRVPDYEQVWKAAEFDFAYLGAEEGRRKAALDDAREAGTAEAELAIGGRWAVSNKQDGGSAVYTLWHEPGSASFEGEQEGFTQIKDGTLDGKTVRWNIGEFTCCGQVEDSGRTMSDIKVTITRSGMLFGVFDGLRLFEASCWTSHPGYDLRGRADAEQMDARDLDAVKRRVEKMGYAGFCVWQGFAYIKGCGSKPLTQEDLEYGGDENPVVFHLFTPPDPHEEARRWARRQGAQPEAQRAAEPQVEAPREPSRDAAAPAHRQSVSAEGRAKEQTRPAEREPLPQPMAVAPAAREPERVDTGVAESPQAPPSVGATPSAPSVSLGSHAQEASQLEASPQPAAPAQEPERGPEPTGGAAAQETVKLTVTSAEDEDVVVRADLPATATIRDLRRRLLGTGGAERAGVTIFIYDEFFDKVDRTLGDDELVSSITGTDRQYVRLGGAPLPLTTAEAAEEAEVGADLDIVVVVDRSLGLSMPAKMPRGSTVRELRDKLSASDFTGQAGLGNWSLGLPRKDGSAPALLHDTAILSEEHAEVEVIED